MILQDYLVYYNSLASQSREQRVFLRSCGSKGWTGWIQFCDPGIAISSPPLLSDCHVSGCSKLCLSVGNIFVLTWQFYGVGYSEAFIACNRDGNGSIQIQENRAKMAQLVSRKAKIQNWPISPQSQLLTSNFITVLQGEKVRQGHKMSQTDKNVPFLVV